MKHYDRPKTKPKFKVGQLLVNKYGYSDNVALVVKHAVSARSFVDYDVVFKGEVHNWPEAYLTSQFKETPQPDIENHQQRPTRPTITAWAAGKALQAASSPQTC